jgi:hypothetical protein
MFETQPTAAAPIRQLRFAPAPEEYTPYRVQLFLTVEEEFTDNADQTKDNRRSEFRTRVVPAIFIGVDRPLGRFSLSYAPEVFFPGNSIGDTELNQNLSARAALWPTEPFQLTLSNDFAESNDFRDIEDPGSRSTGGDAFLRNVASAEAAYVLGRLRTAFAYTNIINQEDVGFWDTRISHIMRPSVLYTDPRYSLEGNVVVTRGGENSSVESPYWRYEANGRYLHIITPTISAGFAGGYQYQEPDREPSFNLGRGRVISTFGVGVDGTAALEAGVDVFGGAVQSETEVTPSFLASYTHRFLVGAVTARYEQGYRNRSEDLFDEGVTFTRSAGIFLTTAFFRDLVATFGVRYVENEFLDQTGSGPPTGTTERTWAVDVAFRYLLARSLFLNFAYSGTFRTSTDPAGDEFNENLFRVGLRYEYNVF